MANTITEITGKANTNFVGPTSRYLNSQLVNYNINGTTFLTFSTFKKPKRTPSPEDKVYLITRGTEFRPDIVAKKVYNNENYWWAIMLENNIFDVYDFKAGLTIKLPSPFLTGA